MDLDFMKLLADLPVVSLIALAVALGAALLAIVAMVASRLADRIHRIEIKRIGMKLIFGRRNAVIYPPDQPSPATSRSTAEAVRRGRFEA